METKIKCPYMASTPSNPERNINRVLWSMVIVLFVLLLPQFALADGWKVHVTRESAGQQNYSNYTLRITEWDFSSTLPNPLYGCTIGQCSVALSLNSGSTFPGTQLDNSKDVTSAKTIGELGLVMQRKGTWFGKTHVKSGYLDLNYCAIAGYMINGGNHSTPLPGGQCTYGELPPTTCSFDMPSIELRHTEYDTTVNGSRVSGRINITCIRPMKVDIKGQYSGVNSIALDSKSKFESVLTLNDQPLSSGVQINASPSPTAVTITSTLKGTPPPGEYQGSTVIIIAMQ